MGVKSDNGPMRPIVKRKLEGYLNKMRWFCNICQKQCKDYSGFQIHLVSKGHRQQVNIGLRMIADFNARAAED